MIYILSFYTCCQIEAILKIANFLNWQKFEVQANFFIISVTEVCYINRIAKGTPYILSYWSKF